MWWSRVSLCALSLSFVLGAVGCGSSGFDGQGSNDALTMRFVGFTGEGIDQQDTVGNDVGGRRCLPDDLRRSGGIFTDEVFESFTQTRANAIFVNIGIADILLDSYIVSSLPGTGFPDRTVKTAVLHPGRALHQLSDHALRARQRLRPARHLRSERDGGGDPALRLHRQELSSATRSLPERRPDHRPADAGHRRTADAGRPTSPSPAAMRPANASPSRPASSPASSTPTTAPTPAPAGPERHGVPGAAQPNGERGRTDTWADGLLDSRGRVDGAARRLRGGGGGGGAVAAAAASRRRCPIRCCDSTNRICISVDRLIIRVGDTTRLHGEREERIRQPAVGRAGRRHRRAALQITRRIGHDQRRRRVAGARSRRRSGGSARLTATIFPGSPDRRNRSVSIRMSMQGARPDPTTGVDHDARRPGDADADAEEHRRR